MGQSVDWNHVAGGPHLHSQYDNDDDDHDCGVWLNPTNGCHLYPNNTNPKCLNGFGDSNPYLSRANTNSVHAWPE